MTVDTDTRAQPASASDSGRDPVLARRDAEREELAERIADRLDVPVTAAGTIFLVLVLVETVSKPEGAVGTVFEVTSWVLWTLFVAEFVVRLVIAPSKLRFMRRNGWQLLFLAVPALRFVRGLRALRTARLGRVLSSAIRSSRSAGRKLSSRLTALGVITVVVTIAASQLLFELGSYDSYADALHAAALATIAGEPIRAEHSVLRIVEIALVAYSVVVFAALAGTLGAFLLERSDEDRKLARRSGAS